MSSNPPDLDELERRTIAFKERVPHMDIGHHTSPATIDEVLALIAGLRVAREDADRLAAEVLMNPWSTFMARNAIEAHWVAVAARTTGDAT